MGSRLFKKITAFVIGVAVTTLVSAAGTGEHEHNDMHSDGAHKHDRWVEPPSEYKNRQLRDWNNSQAILRGGKLYADNCMSCHGADGKGSGPAAAALAHAPADLTNHFHNSPGDGDAYLFWRVSEGGLVEPFKSMNSAMPSFKAVLSEQQRWDVLRYVHGKFHKGFKTMHHDEKHHEH